VNKTISQHLAAIGGLNEENQRLCEENDMLLQGEWDIKNFSLDYAKWFTACSYLMA
jgi:hypothetical protein